MTKLIFPIILSFSISAGAAIGFFDCKASNTTRSAKAAAEIREISARAEKAESEARSAFIILQKNRLELAQKQAEFDEKMKLKNEENHKENDSKATSKRK